MALNPSRARSIRAVLTLTAILVCALLAPSAEGAAPMNGKGYGLADPVYGQWLPETHVARLRPQVYRVQIPYDIMGSCPGRPDAAAELEARLRRVRQLGVTEVLGTFAMNCKRFFGDVSAPAIRPDVTTYNTEITKVIAKFDTLIDQWSPANEPNYTKGWFGNSINTGGPELLASYFNVLRLKIPADDELVSPEFVTTASPTTGEMIPYSSSDTRSLQKVFITRYLNAVANIYGAGSGWGSHAALHPYAAVTSKNKKSITEFESLVSGADVWFTEIGGIAPNSDHPSNYSLDSQVAWLADTARTDARVSRAYYYNPYEVSNSTWDSSLIDDYGTPRQAWKTWCSYSRYLGPYSTPPCGTDLNPFNSGIYGYPAEDYHVWRLEPDAGWVQTPQVAQRVVAMKPYLRSASFLIGGSADGRAVISIYRDAWQTNLIGRKIVNVNAYGETTATFDPALPVTPGAPYYVQATSPVSGGQLQIYYSTYDDDYRSAVTNSEFAGGAQYNWDANDFRGPNVNGRVTNSADNDREHFSVVRPAAETTAASVNQVAQKFTATLPTLTSVSAKLLAGASGKFYFSIYKDAAQTQLVPGGSKLVTANPDPSGSTTAIFDTPLSLNPGSRYYFQVIGYSGDFFTVYRSTRNDYAFGGAQFNWDSSDFAGPDVIARIVGASDSSVNSYLVWRYEPEANWLNVPQAAQQFKATNNTIRSVSVLVGASPAGLVRLGIYRNKQQTDLVATSDATVAVTPYGETKVTYSTPVPVTPGQTYYLQIIHPAIAVGNVQIYRSGYDDYQEGGAQYNWDAFDFTGTDFNAKIVSGP